MKTPPLTDRERAILAFEAGPHWRYTGTKETAIREEFGISATRYYQLLNALIDHPEAAVLQPMLVKRLHRLRDARRRRRAS